jgi:hypothetical protein
MSQPTFDLCDLFDAALGAVSVHCQEINDLDVHHGNHGDHMLANLRLTTEALRAQRSRPPAEALHYAGQSLRARGCGGAGLYYADGLEQAADLFQGQLGLGSNDVLSLVQLLLDAIPSQDAWQDLQARGSVLDQLIGLVANRPPQAGPHRDGLDGGDSLGSAAPAGLAFLLAHQAGVDLSSAARQAAICALMEGQVDPFQAGTCRAAAAGLIAQGMLRAMASQ